MERVPFFVVHKDWSEETDMPESNGCEAGMEGSIIGKGCSPRSGPGSCKESSIFLGVPGAGLLSFVCYLNLYLLTVLEKLSTL